MLHCTKIYADLRISCTSIQKAVHKATCIVGGVLESDALATNLSKAINEQIVCDSHL
jgi:hypothetical protein